MNRSQVPVEFLEDEPQMTQAQKAYLLDLINNRVMKDKERREAYTRINDGLTRKQASAWIEKALTLPKRKIYEAGKNSEFSHRLTQMPKVPDGRYAVMFAHEVAGEDVEILKFFKVRTPTEGKWQGFMFLDAGRGGGHGDLQWTPVKELEYKTMVLKLIEKDPKAAGQRFGQEVGICCRCGRTLTDETSRSLGIGPDCRDLAGW